MQRVIIGTAGHVDHGKSTLVKALSGVDPDRLPEEKARGMTIDLGFVFLPIGGGEEVAIIDVPGHERFVKTMIAGATSIRLVLFVVAADEGVMPQTREHLDILKLLGVDRGIIVLTKTDKVTEEEAELAAEDLQNLIRGSFLETAPLIKVSSTTGQGLEDLRRSITDAVRKLPPLACGGIFRTPIDRVFSIKGFGTIVAGTVVSGCLKRSESVEVLPIQKTSRLRGLQVHNLPVEEVFTGQRVAFNLADLSKSELDKGFELSRPGFYEPTQRVYVEISLLPALTRSLASGARIRLHKGTCEVMARVKILDQEQIQPGGRGLAMLRLESPVSAIRNERCLLRMYSPMILIGSGTILESHPEHYRRERREALEYLNALRIPGGTCVEQIIRYRITPVRSEGETAKAANLTETAAGAELERLLGAGTVLRMKDGSFIHRAAYDAGRETLTNLLKTLHERSPMLRYIPAAALFKSGKSIPPILLEKIVGDLAGEGTIERRNQDLRLAAHTVSLSADFKALLDRVEQWAVLGGYKTFELGKITSAFPDQAPDTIQNTVVYLTDTGRLAEIQSGEYLSSSALRRAEQALREYLREKPGIRASEFKDIINISRETARSILDYFLKTGITVRNQGTHTLADRDPDKTNG